MTSETPVYEPVPMGDEPLLLPQWMIDKMIAHAREEAAAGESGMECCGIIASKDRRAVHIFRARNGEESPFRYTIHKDDIQKIDDEIGANGWEYRVVYHSHLGSPAQPSPTDVRRALPHEFYPDLYYVLVSLAIEPPSVRAFRIIGTDVTEQPLTIEGE
jgi:proteasome lid subunit RPN8/RPN11